MIRDRLDALNLLENLRRRMGFRLDDTLRHCDPVKENSFRLFLDSFLNALFFGDLAFGRPRPFQGSAFHHG